MIIAPPILLRLFHSFWNWFFSQLSNLSSSLSMNLFDLLYHPKVNQRVGHIHNCLFYWMQCNTQLLLDLAVVISENNNNNIGNQLPTSRSINIYNKTDIYYWNTYLGINVIGAFSLVGIGYLSNSPLFLR